jgi:hypothetical protein
MPSTSLKQRRRLRNKNPFFRTAPPPQLQHARTITHHATASNPPSRNPPHHYPLRHPAHVENATAAASRATPPDSATKKHSLMAAHRTYLVAEKEPGSSTEAPSAINSTVWTDATQANARTPHTSARFATQPTTAPKPAGPDPRKVNCLLLPDNWETELRALSIIEEFKDILPGLREGFRIGAHGAVTTTYTPPNHKSALVKPLIIQKHIDTEVAAGRYTGPFTRDTLQQLIGPFRTAPLGIVDKASSPGNFRVIQDFSYPRDSPLGTSLNSQINLDNFSCTWGFFADVAKAVSLAPPGSMAATFDVDAAYRQMPVHPHDQAHIIVGWNDLFWVDHRIPFGAASSNGIFGRCGDAIARIYSLLGYGDIFKWVDDFLFIQSPPARFTPSFTPPLFSESAIYEVAHNLGWPWKVSKTKVFAPIFHYLGFEWDLAVKQVRIPTAKRKKFLIRLSSWQALEKVDLRETEVLIGSLVHCALALPAGRAHIAGLIAFSATFPRAYKQRFLKKAPPKRAVDEVSWWTSQLSTEHCSSVITPPPPTAQLTIHSDASTSFGLGVTIEGHFMAWKLLPGWKAEERDIGWAKAIAVEMALEWVMALGTHDASLTIHCDNLGVVGAWTCGRSRNRQQNDTIARITARAASANLWISLTYIESSLNPADYPSRGVSPPKSCVSPICLPIPAHLRTFLSHTGTS